MGRASRIKRERRLAGAEQHSGQDGGFVGGRPVDAELRPAAPPRLEAEYRVREVAMADMVRWKLSTPQPEPGAAGASEILRRVRAEGETLVMVNRGPAGVPEAVVWVCPGCGNTWARELGEAKISWARGGSDLVMTLSEPLACPEAAESRCPAPPWALRAGTLSRADSIDQEAT